MFSLPNFKPNIIKLWVYWINPEFHLKPYSVHYYSIVTPNWAWLSFKSSSILIIYLTRQIHRQGRGSYSPLGPFLNSLRAQIVGLYWELDFLIINLVDSAWNDVSNPFQLIHYNCYYCYWSHLASFRLAFILSCIKYRHEILQSLSQWW